VSSKAIFTGVDNSDPNASAISIFRDPKNHASAVTSILFNFSKEAAFEPKVDGLTIHAQQFFGFATLIKSCPVFQWRSNAYDPELHLTGDLNQLKEAIAAKYVPISIKADAVAAALVDQIPKSGTPSVFLSSMILITIHGGNNNEITLDTAQLQLMIDYSSKSAVIPAQVAHLFQETYKILDGYFHADPESYAKMYPKVDVKTLTDHLTTPKSKGTNQLPDVWFSGTDHTCETKPEPSKYTHRQRLYRLSQLRMDY